jgi:hypothetical protein
MSNHLHVANNNNTKPSICQASKDKYTLIFTERICVHILKEMILT